ncbi:hypothetical protein K1719_031523 [Acacia pycnantha]|nr:hypothetical protein K1719_031523 [Acacia pycnantha]
MERTLVVKLLGRYISYHDLNTRTQALWQLKGSFQLVDLEGNFYFATFDLEEDYIKVLTGGPWMVFGAYLTVQPWSLDFDTSSYAVSKVVAWVRIPSLSISYYHKSTLRAIGSLLGEVVKIDYLTESRGRGKYARIAIIIDLIKPLVPWIKVDGKQYGVEYEGLPVICFECGKYSHSKERCKNDVQSGTADHPSGMRNPNHSPTSNEPSHPPGSAAAEGSSDLPPSQYGSWMQNEDLLANSTLPNPESNATPAAFTPPIKQQDVNRHTDAARGYLGTQMIGQGRELTRGISKAHKQGSHKPISGQPHNAQVYKKKEPAASPSVGPHPTQPTANVQITGAMPINSDSGSGPQRNDKQLDEPNLVMGHPGELNNKLKQQSVDFIPLKQESSLNAIKHTVVSLQPTHALALSVGLHNLEEPPDGLLRLICEDAEGIARERMCSSLD